MISTGATMNSLLGLSVGTKDRTLAAPEAKPLLALPNGADERAAFNRLFARRVITGRELTPLAVLDAYRGARPLLRSPSITAPSEIPEVLE